MARTTRPRPPRGGSSTLALGVWVPTVKAAVVVGAVAVCPSLPAQAAQRPAVATVVPDTALVFEHVTVIDVEEGRRLRDQRVVIAGHRIRALGRGNTVRLPPGARIIDARGKFLSPGLWNMHVHFFGRPDFTNLATVANGVTGIREAGTEIPLDTLRRWKQEIAAGTRIGPRLLVSGQATDEEHNGPCVRDHRSMFTCVSNVADARHYVDSLQANGADLIKTYGSLSDSLYFAIAAEARRIGIPFGGHLPWAGESATGAPVRLDGRVASDSGARILDHETYFTPSVCEDNIASPGWRATHPAHLDLAQCTAAAQRLRRNDTWVTDFGGGYDGPAANLSDSARQAVEQYAWAPLTAEERRHRRPFREAMASLIPTDSATGQLQGCASIRMMYAANLPLLANSDWGHPGFIVHRYLELKVLCGVPALWVLQTATLNPVRAMHLDDSLGTVATGKLADLVLLDGDPLADIGNVTRIRAVVANGRYFDRAALDRLLIDAAAANVAYDKAQAAAQAAGDGSP